MLLHFATIVLSSNLVLTSAEKIPQFDVTPSCRVTETIDVGSGRTMEMCKKDEMDARDALGKQWTQFSSTDRARCVNLTRIGGSPSYVELLVCLEMARDVKNQNRSNKNSTTGQGR